MSLDFFDPATDVTVDGQSLSLTDTSSFNDVGTDTLDSNINLFFNPSTAGAVMMANVGVRAPHRPPHHLP